MVQVHVYESRWRFKSSPGHHSRHVDVSFSPLDRAAGHASLTQRGWHGINAMPATVPSIRAQRAFDQKLEVCNVCTSRRAATAIAGDHTLDVLQRVNRSGLARGVVAAGR